MGGADRVSHYENTPLQYAEIFKGGKNDKF